MKTFLWNEYIRNTFVEVDDMTFLTYMGLRIIQNNGHEVEIISVDRLITELYGNTSVSRYVRKGIKESISILDECSKIKILNEIGKQNNKWEINLKGIYLNTDDAKFTVVENTNITQILSLPYEDKKKISLLRYYCILLSTLIKGIGKLSLSSIRLYTDISKSTQIKYNKILEDNGLIYFKHMNAYKTDNLGQIRSLINYYGLPGKKEEINKIAFRALSNKDKKNIVKGRPDANKIRSIKQKINNNLLLDSEEVMLIIDENRHCDEMIENSKDKQRIKRYEEKKIKIDYYNQSILSDTERSKLHNQLQEIIYELGEKIIDYKSVDYLIELVSSVLGENRKACHLTEKELNDEVILYNVLYNTKTQLLR